MIQTKTKPNEECDLTTKELKFDSSGKFMSGYGDLAETQELRLAILATELTYTTLSSVVASSVYVTGNIIHWLEKSIFCDSETGNKNIIKSNTVLNQEY